MASRASWQVFFATPGDLLEEREVFDSTLAEVSADSKANFEPLKWEQVPAATGMRPQSAINDLVDSCDVFILAMHRRWGQSAPDAAAARSYTEEEFRRAVARLNRTGSPEIFCFFKQVDPALLADPGPEFSKVLAFKAQLEDSRQVFIRSFATPTQFSSMLAEHLHAFVTGRLPTIQKTREFLTFQVPEDLQARGEAEQTALGALQQASYCLRAGDPSRAERLLAFASQITTDVRVLDAVRDFFRGRGELITADCVEDRRISLVKDRRLAARRYVDVMPTHTTEAMIANMQRHIPAEHFEDVAAIMREALDSEEFKDEMAAAMAEHLSTGELNTLTRFFSGEGRSVLQKMGRFMGDSIPKIVDHVNERLRQRGYDV